MSDVTNLNEERADRARDCRLWTPLDALRAAIRDIEQGHSKPEQLCIHYLEDNGKGGYKHRFYAAGVTFPQHLALLEVGKVEMIHLWLDGP